MTRQTTKAFVNSLPKSGTNVLQSILMRMPGLKEQRRLGLNRNIRFHPLNLVPIGGSSCEVGVGNPQISKVAAVRFSLSLLRPGRFALGHVPYDGVVEDILFSLGIRPMIVIRNPRDVVLSSVYYALKKKAHFLNSSILRQADLTRQLLFIIEGGVTQNGSRFLGIGEQIDRIVGWVDSPSCLTVRFENVIGRQGGGCAEDQRRTIQEIADWLDIAITEDQAHCIGEDMFGKGRTFRAGQLNGWQDCFSEEVEVCFQKNVGNLARRLGY